MSYPMPARTAELGESWMRKTSHRRLKPAALNPASRGLQSADRVTKLHLLSILRGDRFIVSCLILRTPSEKHRDLVQVFRNGYLEVLPVPWEHLYGMTDPLYQGRVIRGVAGLCLMRCPE